MSKPFRKVIVKPRMTLVLATLSAIVLCLPWKATLAATPQSRCWTTVGSTGTVDEADLGIVNLGADTVAVNSAIGTSTVNVRYNVTAVEGIFSGFHEGHTLVARMADNGVSSQVTVKLIRVNIANGVSTVLGQLDSNSYVPSTVAQRREKLINVCGTSPDWEFDFRNNVYVVDVALIKSGAEGNPLLRAVQICGRNIC